MADLYSIIVKDLANLRRADTKVFGSDMHNFELHAPLTENEVLAFEREHRIRLPEDYRAFLIHVGRGGAGPYYGLFDLGEMDDGFGYRKWKEGDGFVGFLSEPFLYSEPWNDLSGCPDDKLLEQDEKAYENALNDFESRYWAQLNGVIPICHLGCALRQWLVVSGPEAGAVWRDDRADRNGLYPLRRSESGRVSFLQWQRDWLDEALSKIR